MTGFTRKVFYRIINKKTKEEKLAKKIEILKELIEIQKRETAREPEQYVKNLMDDFYLDSIIVSKPDGSIIMTQDNTDNVSTKVTTNSSIYEKIKSEFPDVKMMTIKDDEKYNIIYTQDDLLYLFQSSGDISITETKRIAEKLNEGIKDFSIEPKLNTEPEEITVE